MKEKIVSWSKKDFRIDRFRSGGKGGQHQNTSDTGVRITHIESGISAECRETRSQKENQNRAFRKLVERLKTHYMPEWKSGHGVERSKERIRTYHQVRDTVLDHRTGQTYQFDDIVSGNGLKNVIEDCIRLGITKDEE